MFCDCFFFLISIIRFVCLNLFPWISSVRGTQRVPDLPGWRRSRRLAPCECRHQPPRGGGVITESFCSHSPAVISWTNHNTSAAGALFAAFPFFLFYSFFFFTFYFTHVRELVIGPAPPSPSKRWELSRLHLAASASHLEVVNIELSGKIPICMQSTNAQTRVSPCCCPRWAKTNLLTRALTRAKSICNWRRHHQDTAGRVLETVWEAVCRSIQKVETFA